MIFVLIAAVIVIVVIVQHKLAAKRREELFQLSVNLKLDFFHDDMIGAMVSHMQFRELSVGHSRKASNIMAGDFHGNKLTMFDYQYTTGSGKSKETHYLSFAVLDTCMGFSEMMIREEGLLDGLASAIGFDDIDFESEEFSRKFYVRAEDKKFAYDVIHPRMMQFLLANIGWNVHMLGSSILVYNGRMLNAGEFLKAANFLKEFVGLFPDYLVQRLCGRS